MEFKLRNAFLLMLLGAFVVSCNNDDDAATEQPSTTDEKATLTLDISGLEDLGSDYVYEGWIIVDGEPVSTGTFTVNTEKALSATTFELDKTQLESATKYVLTIEPTVDPDPAPSKAKILAGSFDGTDASLSVGDDSALGVDLTTATGNYILATPTDGTNNTNENSGVWWLNLPASEGAPMTAGLSLPTLPDGWAYEGWAVIDETPVSTGTFTDASMADDAAPFSGTVSTGPNYPGEDFLMNAPEGLTFPTDLAGKTVVISIEPVPDNSAAPFLLKPLVAPVADDATDHTPYTMNNNAAATNPTGTAKR